MTATRPFMRFLLWLLTILCGIDMVVTGTAYGELPTLSTYGGLDLLIGLLFTSHWVRRFMQ